MFSARPALFLRGVVLLLSLILLVVFFIKPTYAQTQTTTNSQGIPNYAAPNVNPDVPQNQHTFIQSIFIEFLATSMCHLVGIDPLSPNGQCLGIDPITRKIGFSQPLPLAEKDVRVGGLLGSTTNLITTTYTQPIRTNDYVSSLANDFGIVKKTQAQVEDPEGGFAGLRPIQNLWSATRNITYVLFIIVFIVIGLGIMLRINIDPRTVMTLQNQIPKIIIGLILITFSYAIAAVMIDLMWVSTYVGINTITEIGEIDNESATDNILHPPITYLREIFSTDQGSVDGLTGLTFDLSKSVGGTLEELIASMLVGQTANCSFQNAAKDAAFRLLDPRDNPLHPAGPGLWTISHIPFVDRVPVIGGFLGNDGGGGDGSGSLSECVYLVLFTAVNWIATMIVFLIILITLVVLLFRVWFMLLKAYAYVIIYIVAAPFWIIAGLLPGNTMGFGSWLRGLFANLAVFPAAAFLFLLAKVVIVHLNQDAQFFSPPLVGNPGLLSSLGSLIGFGILLLTPELLNIIRDALKRPPSKYGGAVRAGIGLGAAVPGAVGERGTEAFFRRDQARNPIGTGAFLVDRATGRITGSGGPRPPAGPRPTGRIGGFIHRLRHGP